MVFGLEGEVMVVDRSRPLAGPSSSSRSTTFTRSSSLPANKRSVIEEPGLHLQARHLIHNLLDEGEEDQAGQEGGKGDPLVPAALTGDEEVPVREGGGWRAGRSRSWSRSAEVHRAQWPSPPLPRPLVLPLHLWAPTRKPTFY